MKVVKKSFTVVLVGYFSRIDFSLEIMANLYMMEVDKCMIVIIVICHLEKLGHYIATSKKNIAKGDLNVKCVVNGAQVVQLCKNILKSIILVVLKKKNFLAHIVILHLIKRCIFPNTSKQYMRISSSDVKNVAKCFLTLLIWRNIKPLSMSQRNYNAMIVESIYVVRVV